VVEEMALAPTRHQEFDASEMSFFLPDDALAGDDRFTVIPVFTRASSATRVSTSTSIKDYKA
jgi:hypothetical protein